MGFWGDLPTWITTLIAAFAAWFGLRQYRKDISESQIRHERERKSQPAMLGVWWAHHIAGGQYSSLEEASQKGKIFSSEIREQAKRKRGLLISNQSHTIFHDITIHARLDSKSLIPVEIRSLPPGSYFTLFMQNENGWGWIQSTEVLPGNLTALTEAKKYEIASVNFTDNLGQSWETNGHGTLNPAPLPSVPRTVDGASTSRL